MDESNDSDIAAILLGFSTLDKTQRDEFMAKLNDFMYASWQQKRKLMSGWLQDCKNCTNPAVHRIAESMADYAVNERKWLKHDEPTGDISEDDDTAGVP